MARYELNQISVQSSTTSITASLPDHSSGKVLIVFATISGRNASLTTSTTGWIKIVGSNYGTSMSTAAFYKVASSSSETAPVIDTDSTASNMMATALVCDGINTSDIVEAYTTYNGSGEGQNPPSVTTANDDCLILIHAATTSDYRDLALLPPLTQVVAETDATVDIINAVGIYTQVTAGATPSNHLCISGYGSTSTLYTVIAINTSSGNEEPTVDPTCTPGELFLPLCRTIDYLCDSEADPTSSIIPDINGESTVYGGLSRRAFAKSSGCDLDSMSFYSYTTNVPLVSSVLRTSSMNMSNANISIGCYMDFVPGAMNPVSTGGRYIGFSDGTNSEVWKVEAIDAIVNSLGGAFSAVIGTDTPPLDSNGTINWAAIDRIIIGVDAKGGGVNFSFCWKLGTMVVIGGSTNRPANFSYFAKQYHTGRIHSVFDHKGYTDSQYTSTQSLQIGSPSEVVNWKSAGQSLAFPPAYNESTVNIRVNITSGSIGLYIYASSGSNIDLSSTTINGGDFHKVEMHASTHNSDIYNFTNCLILSALVTLRNLSNVDYSGLTLSGCKELVHNSANLNGVILNNCVDAQAVTITSESDWGKLTGATFKNNSVAIKITGNQSHTGAGWADALLTVSGNTYDIEYTGTTNFSIQSNVSLNVNNSSSGVLTIVTPSPTVTVTVTDESGTPIENARVFIRASGGGSTILNALTNSSGVATTSYTGSLPQAIEGWVRKATTGTLFKQFTLGGSITSGGYSATAIMQEDQ